MKKWMVMVGWLLLGSSAQAWRPAGWVYANWPYAYEQGTRDWYWFSPHHVHWAYGFPPADGWKRMNETGLAQGWSWHARPYAYCFGSTSWYFFAAHGRHWCVNLRTGIWSVFGLPPAPSGMTVIPGGTNAGTDPDFGAYSLTVGSFFMDRHEVTKALWDEVYAWAIVHGYAFDNAGVGKAANHPVGTVNWHDCAKWCNARSERAGLVPAYYTDAACTQIFRTGRVDLPHVKNDAVAYRLPTLTEWQYAARGGVANRRFAWGDSDLIGHDRANFKNFQGESYTYGTLNYHPTYYDGVFPVTSPVGSFAPNGYGLHDMVGNAWEWCMVAGAHQMLAGGGWGRAAYYCRIGDATQIDPNLGWSEFGFRTVQPPSP